MTATMPPLAKLRDEADPDSALYRLWLDESPTATQEWIEKYLTVANERGQIVHMKLFPQQIKMLYDETGRDVTIKGRQTRASTLKLARRFRRFVTGQVWGANCLVAAESDPTTALFREKIQHWVGDLKRHDLALEIGLDNADELVIKEFENRFVWGSGEQKVLGRGYAIQEAHLCLAADTEILAEDGFLDYIVAASGKVWTHKGRHVPIKGLSESGRRPVVRVILPDQKITATPNHQFWTDEGWMAADSLAGHWVGIPQRPIKNDRQNNPWSLRHRKGQHHSNLSIRLTSDFGRVVGLFLAEGTLGKSVLQFAFHRKETEYADLVRRVLGPYATSISEVEVENTRRVVVRGAALRHTFRDYIYRRGDKAIPDSFWRYGREFLAGVIRGYFEGDGYIGERRELSVTSVRPQLLTQTREALLSLYGVWGSITSFTNKGGYKPGAVASHLQYSGTAAERIRGAYGWPVPPRQRQYKQRDYRVYDNYAWIRVQRVEDAGVAETFDLVLDDDDHSFRTKTAVVHNSEFAHWQAAAISHMGSMLPAVPGAPVGRVDIESTPKGETGAFWKYATSARPHNPHDLWTVHLYQWWMEPRYRVTDDPLSGCDILIPHTEYVELTQSFRPSDYEARLMSLNNLDVDRILWRRIKKIEQDKTPHPFLQEFPESEDTCFIGEQGKFFDTPDGIDHLEYYRSIKRPPLKLMESLRYNGAEISFYGPNFGIWEFPDPARQYLTWADCAGGGLGDEADWTVIYVYDIFKEKIVARLRLQCSPKVAAAMGCAIGSYYNTAWLGAERSHHGDTFLRELRDLAYGRVYYHSDPFNPLKTGESPKPGMYPTPTNRQKSLESFKSAVVMHAIEFYCPELVREMSSFTWNKVQEKLKASAQDKGGLHDDCVMAAAEGYYVVSLLRMRLARTRQRKEEEVIVTGRNGLVLRRLPQGAREFKPWLY